MDAPAMQAGRELDALIAERVMGWCAWRSPLVPRGVTQPDCWQTGERNRPAVRMSGWSPSTNIADAWKVFDVLGGHVTIHTINGGWACRINDWMRTHCWAETPALAICRSALAAVAIKEETAA